ARVVTGRGVSPSSARAALRESRVPLGDSPETFSGAPCSKYGTPQGARHRVRRLARNNRRASSRRRDGTISTWVRLSARHTRACRGALQAASRFPHRSRHAAMAPCASPGRHLGSFPRERAQGDRVARDSSGVGSRRSYDVIPLNGSLSIEIVVCGGGWDPLSDLAAVNGLLLRRLS